PGIYHTPGSSLRRYQLVRTGEDLEFITPVLGPGFLVRRRIHRPLLAEGNDLDAGPVHSLGREIAFSGRGAFVPQHQVVFVGAALVGVARDLDPERWVGQQDGRLAVQEGGVRRADFVPVVVEVDR